MKLFYKYDFNGKTIYQIPALKDNYLYMIALGTKAWIFDPGEADPVERTLRENQLSLEGIYITHHHPDHVGGIKNLVKSWKCPVYGHKKDNHRIPMLSHPLQVGDSVEIGDIHGKVLFFPGHTLGLIGYYFEKEKWLFSNDLIFSLGCGRVFEGTYEQMFQSLKKASELPKDTLLMISHEYTLANLQFGLSQFPNDKNLLSIKETIEEKVKNEIPTVPTTLEFERQNNPFLRWDDPKIKKALYLESASESEVFSEIRSRKDHS